MTVTLPMLRTSERKDFKRCPQRWHWTWRDGLDTKGPPNDKLWFGTGWHEVMAHWYQPGKTRGKEPLKVWRDWVKDEMVKIRVNIPGDAEYREEVYMDAGRLGELMIGNYIEKYGQDRHINMIMPEKSFEVILADQQGVKRVLFCGTYDGIYRDEDTGFIWLLEHKTAKAIRTNHLTLDNQAGGYLAIATRELRASGLIGKKEAIKGILYNFARKAPKPEKEPAADGLVHNKPTKEHYITQLGLDPEAKWTLPALEGIAIERQAIVLGDVSKLQPLPLFHREPVRRTLLERNSILRGIQAEVQHMEAMRTGELPLYKNSTFDCRWDCKFYDMCVLHEAGNDDWKLFRDTQFLVRDPYADHRKSAQDGDD